MERRDRPVDAQVLVRSGAPPLLFITGPTAVGQSALALSLAERLDAEILSCDSRQVYRQLTIGPAKPSAADLAAVEHHFINELDLGEPFSAGMFAREAVDRIKTISERGKMAIVVGGSTLYLRALAHGLSDIPETSPYTRAALTARLRSEGSKALFDELARVDPESAATMDASKTQRVLRALEVYHDTGRPLSSYHRSAAPPPFNPVVVTLYRERAALYARVNERVERMLEAGLVDENRQLLKAGFSDDLNPLKTIGYREPRAFLRGETTFDEMVRKLKQNSRRYAKRQLTWFRKHSEYHWVDLGGGFSHAEHAVLKRWQSRQPR